MRSRLIKLLLLALAGAGLMKLLRPEQQSIPATTPAQRPTTPAKTGGSSVRPSDTLPEAEPFSDPLDEPADLPPAAAQPITDAPAPAPIPVVAEDLDPLPQPPHGPFTTAPEGDSDDLKRISGVGPKLESMLNEQGITTLAQLADLDDTQIDELQARLPQFPGRIRRDDWVGQAARLRSS